MTPPQNTELRDRLHGLWLPLVTPFRDGQIDEISLRRLVAHYARQPIDGLILAASYLATPRWYRCEPLAFDCSSR